MQFLDVFKMSGMTFEMRVRRVESNRIYFRVNPNLATLTPASVKWTGDIYSIAVVRFKMLN